MKYKRNSIIIILVLVIVTSSMFINNIFSDRAEKKAWVTIKMPYYICLIPAVSIDIDTDVAIEKIEVLSSINSNASSTVKNKTHLYIEYNKDKNFNNVKILDPNKYSWFSQPLFAYRADIKVLIKEKDIQTLVKNLNKNLPNSLFDSKTKTIKCNLMTIQGENPFNENDKCTYSYTYDSEKHFASELEQYLKELNQNLLDIEQIYINNNSNLEKYVADFKKKNIKMPINDLATELSKFAVLSCKDYGFNDEIYLTKIVLDIANIPNQLIVFHDGRKCYIRAMVIVDKKYYIIHTGEADHKKEFEIMKLK